MLDNINIELNKISNVEYSTTLPYNLEEYISNLVKQISILNLEKFDTFITEELEDKILSRIITGIFFKHHRHLITDLGFITIQVKYKDRIVYVTVGELLVSKEETVYVNGVLYT